MLYIITVSASAILLIVGAIDYALRAWRRETRPALATWIIMFAMMSMSLWMYFHSDKKSWTGNISVTAGFVDIAIILIGVIATNLRDKTLRVAFDKVQRWCLVGGAVIMVLWFITKRPLLSYTLVQLLAVVAYIATVKKLWRATTSTEPLFLWVAVLTANLCALYPAWVKNDPFSWIYLVRAVPANALMLWLIIRIKYGKKK